MIDLFNEVHTRNTYTVESESESILHTVWTLARIFALLKIVSNWVSKPILNLIGIDNFLSALGSIAQF